MRSKLKVIMIVLALGLAAYAAYAETVTISTYYPSPYGSYQTLETNTLQGAAGTGNIAIVPTGGNVVIGAATPEAWAKLDVHMPANNGVHVFATGLGGLLLGYNGSNIQGRTSTDVNGDLALQSFGGNVGIGGNPGAYKLDVSGTANIQGTLRIRDSTGNAGVLQVSCDGTNCYPVYA